MGLLMDSVITLSVIPIVPFLIVFFIGKGLKKDKKKTFMLAMDVTTFFLLLSVSALFNNIFNSGFGFYLILIIVLISAGLIGGAQNRMKGKVDGKRLFRAVWRLSFFFMSFGYLLFMFVGLITYISQAM
ncbi:DUF3397 domain-containing protein [Paenibacillus sp. FSL R7-0048]|jgi:hypothetical protein|uniref:DUF3397 domain-containing protein n=1 Tax=Paenibacillus odorifer TaxID=189426 RepID=A0A1R0XW57_9BACL|nr:DUF3397 domain-containing protein [Paenibacillus odorifer]OMC72914.1 hypothetical protein BK121_08310 [Paenibacillus odorifer]OMC76441.1 hypothetical protein BK125_18305 [Paenibacillus odorifer]OMD30658.1 hypothetical protein BJP51_19840 [Paenibacillus odorifer]OMD39360.1 hypothetical protein BSO21_02775 [Paenibacillus odorifer]OMD64583.1 hypothetical protein BSK62_16535 [Paenibacillus odorifer]